MKLALAYIASQIAIIVGLAITKPVIVFVAILLGAAIYGSFIMFCKYVVGSRRTPDDQPQS